MQYLWRTEESVPRNWSHRWFWAAPLCVRGGEPESFGKAASAATCWLISPVPHCRFFFLNNVLYICFVCFGHTCLLLLLSLLSSSAGIRFQFLSLFYIDWRSGTLQIGSPETSNFVDGTATEFLAHRQLFLPDPVPITQTNWVAPHFVICTYILLFLFF